MPTMRAVPRQMAMKRDHRAKSCSCSLLHLELVLTKVWFRSAVVELSFRESSWDKLRRIGGERRSIMMGMVLSTSCSVSLLTRALLWRARFGRGQELRFLRRG